VQTSGTPCNGNTPNCAGGSCVAQPCGLGCGTDYCCNGTTCAQASNQTCPVSGSAAACTNCPATQGIYGPSCIVLNGGYECGCNSLGQCSSGTCCNIYPGTKAANSCVAPWFCVPADAGAYLACDQGNWVPAYAKGSYCCGGVGGVCAAGSTCNDAGICQ
jgi:hypothetical protein